MALNAQLPPALPQPRLPRVKRQRLPHSRLAVASFVIGGLGFLLGLVLLATFLLNVEQAKEWISSPTKVALIGASLLMIGIAGSMAFGLGLAAFFQKDRNYVYAIPGIVLGGLPLGLAVEWGFIFIVTVWALW